MFDPRRALEAGLLDTLVSAEDLPTAALGVAHDLGSLDRSAHVATKQRVRQPVLRELHDAIATELT